MKTFLKSALIAALLTTGAPSFAASLTATGADCAANGLGITQSTTLPSGSSANCGNTSRDDPNDIEFNAPATGLFYSLGLGGGLTFFVDPAATGDGAVVEVTHRSNHKEAVDVYVSNDGINWGTAVTRIINNHGNPSQTTHTFSLPSGSFSHIGFLDVTLLEFDGPGETGSTDGFDIGAVTLNTVPLPAPAFMLLAGLAGLGAMRRRKKS